MNGWKTHNTKMGLGRVVSSLVLGCVMAAGLAASQIQNTHVPREAGIASLESRLESLSPAHPQEYFELAEELAYLSSIAPNQRGTALRMAGQLYVLAYELDRAKGGGEGLGRSVCLGLADIAAPEDRDWLLALAASFGGGSNSHQLAGAISSDGSEDSARADAAEALGRYRAVERQPLSAIMRRVDVRRQLRAAGVNAVDTDWVMARLEQGLQRPYCPECRNQRLVRTGTADQTVEQTLCGTCFSNPEPDPPLSRDELRRMLAVEAALLESDARTWSAELLTGGAEPIADLDPSALAERYGVDPQKPYWVSKPDAALLGQWSDHPTGR